MRTFLAVFSLFTFSYVSATDADERNFMQQGLAVNTQVSQRVGTEEMVHALDAIKSEIDSVDFHDESRRLVMKALMTKVQFTSARLTPENNISLGQVLELLDNISEAMLAEVAPAQSEFDSYLAAFTLCNDQISNTYDGSVRSAENLEEHKFNEAVTTHNTCRAAEQLLVDAARENCSALNQQNHCYHSYLNAHNIPAAITLQEIRETRDDHKLIFNLDVDDSNGRETKVQEWNAFFQRNQFWSVLHSEFSAALTNCEEYESAASGKKSECDIAQTTVETDYCQWRSGRQTRCDTYSNTCWPDAVSAYYGAWATKSAEAATRLSEATQIAKVRCLIVNLRKEITNLDACDNEVPSGNFTLTMTPHDAVQECSTSPDFEVVPSPVAATHANFLDQAFGTNASAPQRALARLTGQSCGR